MEYYAYLLIIQLAAIIKESKYGAWKFESIYVNLDIDSRNLESILIALHNSYPQNPYAPYAPLACALLLNGEIDNYSDLHENINTEEEINAFHEERLLRSLDYFYYASQIDLTFDVAKYYLIAYKDDLLIRGYQEKSVFSSVLKKAGVTAFIMTADELLRNIADVISEGKVLFSPIKLTIEIGAADFDSFILCLRANKSIYSGYVSLACALLLSGKITSKASLENVDHSKIERRTLTALEDFYVATKIPLTRDAALYCLSCYKNNPQYYSVAQKLDIFTSLEKSQEYSIWNFFQQAPLNNNNIHSVSNSFTA